MFRNNNIVNNQVASLIDIKKLVLSESGTYEDMFLRPNNSHVDSTNIEQLSRVTGGLNNLAESNLGSIAGSFIKPAAEVEAKAFVDNGWDTRRFKFHMTIERVEMQTTILQIISGYTDHAEMTMMSKNIAQDTKFYITNVLELNRQRNKTIVKDNNQILHDSGRNENKFDKSTRTYTMTPSDVFTSKQSELAIRGLGALDEYTQVRQSSPSESEFGFGEDSGYDDDFFTLSNTQSFDTSGIELHDSRTTFAPSNPVKVSKRKNNVPGHYLSKLLGGYKDAVETSSFNTSEDIYYDAIGKVRDADILETNTLGTLFSETSFSEGGFFTYRELLGLCPHLDNVTHIGLRSKASIIPNERGVGASKWHTQEIETVISQIINTQLSSIVMDHLVGSLWVYATNDTVNGESVVTFNPISGTEFGATTDLMFLEESISRNPSLVNRLREMLRRTIVNSLMPAVTNNNNNIVTFQVRFDFYGDTWIKLSVNGDQEMDYIVPSFCDSLFSPLITKNKLNLESVAHDIENIFDQIGYGVDSSMSENLNTLDSPFQQRFSNTSSSGDTVPRYGANIDRFSSKPKGFTGLSGESLF